MRMKNILLLLLIFTLTNCSNFDKRVGSQDHYQNFKEMQKENKEGLDYSVDLKNNNSNILVMAFHGGFTESGTTELGRAITKDNRIDFYAFNALKPGNMHRPSFTSSTLHITSTRFDDPRLIEMLPEKDFCVALHGFGGQEADFCIGGGNKEERVHLVNLLNSRFKDLKSCDLCCPPFNGTSPKNPINRCKEKGVQVEMSPKVRKKILADKKFLNQLSDTFVDFLN